MKTSRIFTLAFIFAAVTCSAPVWATPAEPTPEEECQTLAAEQKIPGDELEAFIEKCLEVDSEDEDTVTGQE